MRSSLKYQHNLQFFARLRAICGLGRACFFAGIICAAPLLVAEEGQGQFFHVRSAATTLVDNVFRLDAEIEIFMSPQSKEALHNGIPLVFEIKIEVVRERPWLWNSTIASLVQRYHLSYHALSQRYRVKNFNSGMQRNFRSLSGALRMIGTLDDFPMLDEDVIELDQSYFVRLRADLDIEALPTPIRLWAYSSPKWRLTSDWYQWRLP